MSDTVALAPRVLEGEVIDPEIPARTFRAVILRSPFSFAREDHHFPEGLAITAVIEQLELRPNCTARVFVNGVSARCENVVEMPSMGLPRIAVRGEFAAACLQPRDLACFPNCRLLEPWEGDAAPLIERLLQDVVSGSRQWLQLRLREEYGVHQDPHSCEGRQDRHSEVEGHPNA